MKIETFTVGDKSYDFDSFKVEIINLDVSKGGGISCPICNRKIMDEDSIWEWPYLEFCPHLDLIFAYGDDEHIDYCSEELRPSLKRMLIINKEFRKNLDKQLDNLQALYEQKAISEQARSSLFYGLARKHSNDFTHELIYALLGNDGGRKFVSVDDGIRGSMLISFK